MKTVLISDVIETQAQKIARHLKGMAFPVAEYCGTVNRTYDRKELFVFGADGCYFLTDGPMACRLNGDPEALRMAFRVEWADHVADRMAVEAAGKTGYLKLRINYRNRAMILWEMEEMGWNPKGR